MCDTQGGPDPGYSVLTDVSRGITESLVAPYVVLTPDLLLGMEIRTYLAESAHILEAVENQCVNSILAAAKLMEAAFRAGGKVLLCGNGGSAADCQHMAAELLPHHLPAISLTTDTSFLTAWSNDESFNTVFSKQVQAIAKDGDVLIAISTSGESINVIHATGMMPGSTIALTGSSGRLGRIADVAICVPSDNTQHIQEAHLAIEHILCELVVKAMNDNQ